MLISRFIFKDSVFIQSFIDSGLLHKIYHFITSSIAFDLISACYSCLESLLAIEYETVSDGFNNSLIPQAILYRMENDISTSFYEKDVEIFCLLIKRKLYDVGILIVFLNRMISMEIINRERLNCILIIAKCFFTSLNDKEIRSFCNEGKIPFFDVLFKILGNESDNQVISDIIDFLKEIVIANWSLNYYSYASILFNHNIQNILLQYLNIVFDDSIFLIMAIVAGLSEINANCICALGYVETAKLIFNDSSIDTQMSISFMITSLLSKGNNQTIEKIVESDMMSELLQMFDFNFLSMTVMILDSTLNALLAENECCAVILHDFLKSRSVFDQMNNLLVNTFYSQYEEINEKCLRIFDEIGVDIYNAD